jgi:hypothetical protein
MAHANTRSLHLPVPRGHALRDSTVVAALLAAIAAFLIQLVQG